MRCGPWDLPHPEAPSKQGSMRRARTASVFPSLLLCRHYFLDSDLAGSLSKLADARQSSVYFFLTAVYLRDDPSDSTAMSRNDQGLSALHIVEQLSQAGFRIGSLNFAHTPSF